MTLLVVAVVGVVPEELVVVVVVVAALAARLVVVVVVEPELSLVLQAGNKKAMDKVTVNLFILVFLFLKLISVFKLKEAVNPGFQSFP